MIDQNDKWKPVNWKYVVIAVMAFAIAFAIAARDANAHHAEPGESPRLTQSRDTFHVNACDRFVFEGNSPSIEFCRAILSAVHTTAPHGQKATRRWVSNVDSLKLLEEESGYAHASINPTSGACGMGQMLPCQKYEASFPCWRKLTYQAKCYIRYVLGRYRTPARAYSFWKCVGWCSGIYKHTTWY